MQFISTCEKPHPDRVVNNKLKDELKEIITDNIGTNMILNEKSADSLFFFN